MNDKIKRDAKEVSNEKEIDVQEVISSLISKTTQ